MALNYGVFVNAKKIGDWEGTKASLGNLETLMRKACILSLRSWALKAEGIAIKHISTQDLADSFWLPLSPYTVERKTRLGYPIMTMLETGTYMQNIISYVDVARLVAFAGVRGGGRSSDGSMSLKDLAITHEYGFLEAGIPPRPLWQPTFEEAMTWHEKSNTPQQHLFRLIQQYKHKKL